MESNMFLSSHRYDTEKHDILHLLQAVGDHFA